jgi:CheY-like chemotaxis protein
MGHDSGFILETNSPKFKSNSSDRPAAVPKRHSYLHEDRLPSRSDPRKGHPGPAVSARSIHPSILLAGCDDGLRSLLRAYLEHVGFKVIACADLAAAFRVLAEGCSAQLLLIDSQLLASSSRILKESIADQDPDLPVFVISGKRMTDGTLSQLKYRLWEPDSQPFRLPDLLGRIQASLEKGVITNPEMDF